MKKSHHRLTIILLVVLIAAALIGWFFTMDAGVAITQRIEQRIARNKAGNAATPSTSEQVLVDERPLQTAQKLAHQVGATSTIEEKHYADRAVQLADHEVDTGFAVALRQASHHNKTLTPPQRELTDRIQKLEGQIHDDQQRLDALMKSAGVQGSGNVAALTDDQQLQIATAQTNLENDQNDLEEAKLQWARVGGDSTSKIERLKADHDSVFHRPLAVSASTNGQVQTGSNGANPSAAPTPGEADHQAVAEVGASVAEPTSLYGQLRDWIELRALRGEVLRASSEAGELHDTLTKEHKALEDQLKQEEGPGKTLPGQTTPQTATAQPTPAEMKSAAHSLAALKALAEDRRTLADLSKRLDNEQRLTTIYQHWADFIGLRERSLMHRILQSSIVILFIMLVVALINSFIDRIFANLTGDRKRLFNLHGVAIFVMQATGVALSALVVFGLPSQLPTVIGLAGAGLTVAMKDFIVGFIGWFILMGKNGIRVGDWVEIQGVGGEVIEVSLLRTVLMETGNWNDAGHPTGRKVSFVNSYAIEGHYFNFSTAGQ